MSWRKFLLIPDLVRTSMRAPRDPDGAWDRYWAGVRETGPSGDVLWDVGCDAEVAWCVERAQRYLDRSLPIVDLGCGNGRFTRALAEHFPAAIGVDVSAHAVERAAAESTRHPRASFRVADATHPDAVADVATEIGASNVFIRGVFHVLDDAARARAARSVALLLANQGRLLLLETAYPGDSLGYLEYVGGGHGRLPALVSPMVQAGVRPPSRFARQELDRSFPAAAWPRIDSGPADIYAIDPDHPLEALRIPGFFAALRTGAQPGSGGPSSGRR